VAGAPAAPAPPRDVTLRYHGLALLVLVGLEIYLGNALALAGSPYPSDLIDAHVVAAALLILVSAATVAIAARRPRALLKATSVVTFLAAVGATASGSIFLWHGQNNGALDGMLTGAGVTLLGAIVLLIGGSVPVAATAGTAP
jgi:hypothetical protein